jgi:hypothetical protein|uniref:Protein kinase domain-containing protein n=1 Tax=viral metagenome TaxID=1070528 RepID=A0A6C0BFU8_9ZZZZ
MESLRKIGSWCTGWGCTRKRRNRIKFSTLRNQQFNKNKPSYITHGATGFTFKNYTDPNKVMKVYFDSNRKKINMNYNKANKISKITGNQRQLVQIVNDFTINDLPTNIPEDIRYRLPNSSLSVMRMPHLGIDLYTTIYDDNIIDRLRRSIPTLIIQCHKLMEQIDKMRRQGLCHGDMRIENIMIYPQTSAMTLIDFDFFGPFIDVFIQYSDIVNRSLVEISQYIPPEFICMKDIYDNTDNIEVFSRKYLNRSMLYFLECIGKDKKEAQNYFSESFTSNKTYIYSLLQSINEKNDEARINEKISNTIMNYFDYFGFGMVMTIFFSRLYPVYPVKYNKSSSIEMILFRQTQKLLMSMCDFSIEKRSNPEEALKKMEKIVSNIANINNGH